MDGVEKTLLALERLLALEAHQIVAVRIGVPVLGSVPEGRPKAEELLRGFSERIAPLLSRLAQETSGKDFPEFPDLGKDFPPPDSPRRP